MNELDPRIVRGEQIITAANRAILDKGELTSAEVKWYLSQDLMARTIFAEVRGSPSPLDSILQKTLGQWDSDRGGALTHLLYLAGEGQKRGMSEMMEASTRCAITLVHEPLIPDCDLEKYQVIARSALHALNYKEKHPESDALCSAYASGLFYNAAKFCPQILWELFADKENVMKEKVNDFRDRFLADLETLQKRPFYGSGT